MYGDNLLLSRPDSFVQRKLLILRPVGRTLIRSQTAEREEVRFSREFVVRAASNSSQADLLAAAVVAVVGQAKH